MSIRFMLAALVLLVLTANAQADRVEYLHTDILGNVVAVTDENANVIERRVYEPYGLPQTPVADGPGFTGHDMDGETGLVYMQQRYYDPMVGQFLSVDPMAVDTSKALNFNRYNYAANNPYKFVDPDGRETRIVFERKTYSDQSIVSQMTVTSDRTDKSFRGHGLEDRNAGPDGNKDPLGEGSYEGFVRTDGSKGFRVELRDTPNFTNVQVHVGNDADDVLGCFAAGTTQSTDYVGGSQNAMNEIQSIVEADGTGDIVVEVRGSNTTPPPPPPVLDRELQ